MWIVVRCIRNCSECSPFRMLSNINDNRSSSFNRVRGTTTNKQQKIPINLPIGYSHTISWCWIGIEAIFSLIKLAGIRVHKKVQQTEMQQKKKKKEKCSRRHFIYQRQRHSYFIMIANFFCLKNCLLVYLLTHVQIRLSQTEGGNDYLALGSARSQSFNG